MKSKRIDRKFSSFGFSSELLAQIEKAGYLRATDIQVKAIPVIQQGRDVLAQAETGSGKTAAYVLPLLENLVKAHTALDTNSEKNRSYQESRSLPKLPATRLKGNYVDVLVLVPTRELALQIKDEFQRFSKAYTTRIKSKSVFGGVKINPQMLSLLGGVDVLVATPGRLLDLVEQNAIKLNKVSTLILDEVDRLVAGDFKEEMDAVFKQLPKKRQNLMFTATFPDSIRTLVRQVLNEPEIINIEPGEKILIDQHVMTVNFDRKNDLLAYLLNTYDWSQVLIFCSAKKTCDRVVEKMAKRGIETVALHSNKAQSARETALRNFKAGRTRVLIATDVAARGIDIPQLPCIINYELPRSPNDYTHRIGRTGRAGEAGVAISLISHQEYQHFSVIEKRSGIRLEREQIPGFEADKEAPPTPFSSGKKKKPKKRANSKKTANKPSARYKGLETKADTTEALPAQAGKPGKPENIAETTAEPTAKKKPKSIARNTKKNKAKAEEKTDAKQKPPVNAHIWGNRK